MLFLGKYDELAPGEGCPSMRENFEATPYSTKDQVLRYLRTGKVHLATAARIIDVYSGEKTNLILLHMNDGEYSWTTKIIYYIDRYNLRLPEVVERNILRKSKTKGDL